MKPQMPTRLCYLRKITLGVQKHSIDPRNQPLCIAAIVFIICSKSHAERSLLYMNAIQHSQRRWNENNGKTVSME
jgi:hypothetical protein